MLVIKAGGGLELDTDAIADDLRYQVQLGKQVVFVHGAAEHTNKIASALGHPPVFVTSESGIISRRTDRQTLEIFHMVYCGKVNKMWVEKLQARGVNAVGLSGLDGRIIQGRRKAKIRIRQHGRRMVIRDDWTGTVEKVNSQLLDLLLDNGFLPVISPPALSFADESINVDGDRIAASLAVHYQADSLIFLSDVPGLLLHYPEEDSLIPYISGDSIQEFVDVAQGRMKRKVMGAKEALDHGVRRVVFADGRIAKPIRNVLESRGGTQIGKKAECRGSWQD